MTQESHDKSGDAGLLAEVIAWLDHPITKQCLDVGPRLTLSHPHLGVKVPEDFAAYCTDLWKRVRAASVAVPELQRRYTPEELLDVAENTLIPTDMHKRSALMGLIAALGDPDKIYAVPINASGSSEGGGASPADREHSLYKREVAGANPAPSTTLSTIGQWVECAKRKPPEFVAGQHYLTWFQERHCVLEYDPQAGWLWGDGSYMHHQEQVTHWQELPSAPIVAASAIGESSK